MDTVKDQESGLKYEAVNGLNPAITLALYRIAGEALSAVFSGEKLIRVESHEYKSASEVLTIIDKKIASLCNRSRAFVRGNVQPIGLSKYHKKTTLKIGSAIIGVSIVE